MTKIQTTHQHTSEGTEYHGFNFSDSKGREIGAMIRQGVSVYTIIQERVPYNTWDVAPGTYLTAYAHSTRDGNKYGAAGRFKMFKITGQDGEVNASAARSKWVAEQLADMKAKQLARNAA